MYRVISIIIFAIFFNLCCSAPAPAAWLRSTNNLVTINGVSYQPEDFEHWWENWREDDSSFPDDLQQFIEWKLLAQEARSMELDQEPDYLHKVEVFYKVRTRVLLKYDTVDSKIDLSDTLIRDRYQDEYTPIWRVSLLYFDSEEKANQAYKDIESKKYSFDELKDKAGSEGAPLFKEGKFRPYSFRDNKDLLQAMEKFSVGQVSKPQQGGNYFILLRLEEITMPDENEFSMKRKQISEMVWKEEEAKLTHELINDLRKKFEVQVDEELMAMVNKNPDNELLSRPVVTTNRESMPLWMVVKDVRKDFKYRKNKVWTEEEKERSARGFLNGMIAEYLLTWEAQDRHYEENPPFKWTYEFYKENRLIKELEVRLIASQITVTEDEINKYYEENPDEFRPPELLSVILLEGDEKLINHVLMKVMHGQGFTQAAGKFNLTPVPIIGVPADKISPEIVKAVSELDIDEVSQPFGMYNKHNLAKLVDRKIQEPLPLAEVEGKISGKLKKEEFSRSRQKYIEMLLEQSDIKVNRRAWKKVQAEHAK